ncbi:MAG TPA: type II toxin-antitoxin system VapC family toxin [Candidatus Deferrimicrobium sp.]|nr:type II toxin-antitoxin system VapC family toxin [Candidatus Deferrimicrobium sp.]
MDTHVWLWHAGGSDRLPRGLRTAVDAAIGHLWYSPISVWEIGMLHVRGMVKLEGGPHAWLEKAPTRFPLEEAALTREVAVRSTELDLGHWDPADHVLAATALVHGLTLVTLDERLRDAGWLPTRSD